MKKIIVIFLILLILLIFAIFWWRNGELPAYPNNKSSVIFVLKKGDGIKEIINDLKEKGLIKSRIVFFLLIKQLGIDKKIQAGDFRLSPSMTAREIAENLTHGTLDIWVTIPEGKRSEEIAEIFKDKLPTYDDSWVDALRQNEGYLFPDTYLIPKDADISIIVSQMIDNFEKKYETLDTGKTKLSKEDVVILASLIEREAKHEKDKPLVASVLLNRLDISMPLQIDATVQYALGYSQEDKDWWKKNLTFEDLKIKSPYNTYVNPGIPPSPIANPGIVSLKAIVRPEETDYLYYISDKSGTNHYAKNAEEHNANIKKFGL